MPANVLLLQGPVGPFFRRLAEELEQNGFQAYKVNFNGGDEFFYRRARVFAFQGKLADWPPYLETRLRLLAIQRIYLFGAFRPYHIMACQVAVRSGIRVFALDEGYIRPDYITLEEVGASGCSLISRAPGFYAALPKPAQDQPRRVPRAFAIMGAYATLYYTAAWMLASRYPHYRHHRPFAWWSEGSKWLLSAFRKFRYWTAEWGVLDRLTAQHSARYYLVPLQVHCDRQVLHQSPFKCVEEFIARVLESFSVHAPGDTALVFKHHPMDRAYRDYARLIDQLTQEHGLSGRVIYVHDLHLPTLLSHARGAVLINSTVGLSSILHGRATIALGQAIYDMPGLTCQAGLDAFWRATKVVDRRLYRRFRAFLVGRNQANGSFYRRLPRMRNPTGVIWPPACNEIGYVDVEQESKVRQVHVQRDDVSNVAPRQLYRKFSEVLRKFAPVIRHSRQ